LKKQYHTLLFAVAAISIALGLILPQKVEAAVNYSVLSSPIVRPNTSGNALGTIQIDISNCAGIVVYGKIKVQQMAA